MVSDELASGAGYVVGSVVGFARGFVDGFINGFKSGFETIRPHERPASGNNNRQDDVGFETRE